MSLRKETTALLETHGLLLTRLRGQHFLVDDRILAGIIDAAGVRAGERVLEIGAGVGTLTAALVAAGAEVTALEIDPRFTEVLQERFGKEKACRIVASDALLFCTDLTAWAGGRPYHVVANLPYQISTPLLWLLLGTDQPHPPQSLTVMVQREVAERMVATPPDMNMLGVLVQSFGSVEIVRAVPQSAFLPPPRVHSAVVHIARGEPPPDRERFLALAKAAFTAPRKKVAGNLSSATHCDRKTVIAFLERANISPDARAETLAVDDWQRLAAVFV